MLFRSCCNHTGDQEHEAGEDLEETGSDGATTGTSHHGRIVLARHLAKYTLNDVLVSTPVPETDDRGTEDHDLARILCIHRVAGISVEHVVDTIAVVHLAGGVHHGCPSLSDAAASEGGKSEEEHEE